MSAVARLRRLTDCSSSDLRKFVVSIWLWIPNEKAYAVATLRSRQDLGDNGASDSEEHMSEARCCRCSAVRK